MKHSPQTVDQRINTFMARKMQQYPELNEKRVRKITVHQRGRFLDDVSELFTLRPMTVRLR